MDGRAPFPTILLLLVVAGAAWFLVDTLTDDSEPAPPVQDADAGRLPAAQAPPSAPLKSAPSGPDEPPAPPDPAPAKPTTGPAKPVERSGPTPPEMFTIASASWKDVATLDVLADVARRTGHVLRVSPGARKILANEKVNLTVENEKAHMVVGKVILKYDVDFAVRGNELRIFLDDD